jgi:hypothetical protein
MTAQAPAIQSIGAPPALHADRVVAEMLRVMAADRARATAAIGAVVRSSSDGTPRGQRKLEARIRAAGAARTHLRTGTRGRYTLMVDVDSGWDPAQDARIAEGDPLPSKPWIACWTIIINGRKRGAPIGMPIVLISHHAPSRAAQRWSARTVDDMLAVVAAIRVGGGATSWGPMPIGGGRRALESASRLVLQEHWMKTLVAATVLANGESD